MFNIHSTEVLLICIVALLVIGPQRLPAAIKTAGLWIGRFRRSFYKVKAEIEREINADEIRRQLHNESVLTELGQARAELETQAKNALETGEKARESVENLVSTDDLDPGASAATAQQSEDRDAPVKTPAPPGEESSATTRPRYGAGRNPRLATSENKAGDDVG